MVASTTNDVNLTAQQAKGDKCTWMSFIGFIKSSGYLAKFEWKYADIKQKQNRLHTQMQ